MPAEFSKRPWGRLEWVLDRLPADDWSVVGSLATEPRCMAVPEKLLAIRTVEQCTLLEVRPPPGHPREARMTELRDRSRERLAGLSSHVNVESHDLLEPYEAIVEGVRAIRQAGSRNVVLDVSCLPKRFFFPALKLLLRDESVETLIVTYTKAEQYALEGLHQDTVAPAPLPLFAPDVLDESADFMIVGLGFDAPGLIQLLEEEDLAKVEVLFPYPSPPPLFGRNWDFLQHAARSIDARHLTITGVSAVDVPAIFGQLFASTEGGRRDVILAPYGPKPMSVAMCLYAVAHGVGVYYTQPQFYNPVYSDGVATDSMGAVVYAYPVRVASQNLYTSA